VRERVNRMDAACLALAARLADHPAVARVLHPASCPNFAAIRRRNGGHGCLLSFELRGGLASARRVYDILQVSKGPSLGTPFTLACPYVLLAHYHELDWAESCGVPRHLLRVSVGLEPPDRLWQRFDHALNSA
jgi:cystathionine gamma-synthase